MGQQKYSFRILRFKPGQIDPPQPQLFEVAIGPDMSVLDGLERIRLTHDATLMYRHCCHHASCGTCACTINGTPALACTTRVGDLNSPHIDLAPLANLPCLGDLVVDMRRFFDDFDANWSPLKDIKTEGPLRTPDGVNQLTQLENCIECGCCIASCPVMSEAQEFMGPAALAGLNNERVKQDDPHHTLLNTAADNRGASACKRHLTCSRVCPSKVYPARHIADLQRAMAKNREKKASP